MGKWTTGVIGPKVVFACGAAIVPNLNLKVDVVPMYPIPYASTCRQILRTSFFTQSS